MDLIFLFVWDHFVAGTLEKVFGQVALLNEDRSADILVGFAALPRRTSDGFIAAVQRFGRRRRE